MFGNPVRFGDGSATVTGNRPPTATGRRTLGRRGRGSKPGVRRPVSRCSRVRTTSPRKRRLGPGAPAVLPVRIAGGPEAPTGNSWGVLPQGGSPGLARNPPRLGARLVKGQMHIRQLLTVLAVANAVSF